MPRDSEQTRVTRIHGDELEKGADGPPGEACIIVIYGPDLGKRMSLGTAPFEIGRSSKNDLFLDQESVSRHHARITFDGKHHWVQDLASTNGTYVNDEVIREKRLRDGDLLRVGRTILKFMTGENIEVHYHEEIYRLMTIDGLTQAYNRRYFDEALEREFNRSRRYTRDLSLVAMDIDFFKRVNDTYGHLAGDSLLRQLAASVKPKLRRDDIFARTGGEEFAVLLPEIALDGARLIAEKIRRIVETTTFRHEQLVIPCTVSLGIAMLGAEDTPEIMYKRADERLYEAKQKGRNRVAG
jgi:diguanylate cyclase (GGDEF)-like protein